jgi:hypothetical protein
MTTKKIQVLILVTNKDAKVLGEGKKLDDKDSQEEVASEIKWAVSFEGVRAAELRLVELDVALLELPPVTQVRDAKQTVIPQEIKALVEETMAKQRGMDIERFWDILINLSPGTYKIGKGSLKRVGD